MSSLKLTDFYNDDVPAYASYDNIRKIACYVDGLKASMRKIIFSAFNKLQHDSIKTENFCNMCAAETNYLHGASNLCGVANTLTQSFVGANNYPLLEGFGSFGTRINPTTAAPRYTKIKLSKNAKSFYNEADFNVVDRQLFEGDLIEPRYFVPIVPVILLNGSEGVSTGFSQKILPRSLSTLTKYINAKLTGSSKLPKLIPWYKGFQGTFEYDKDGKLSSIGCIKQLNTTTYHITELPIGLSYVNYIDFLEKLVDEKVISDYIDKCDTKTDNILFVIKTTRAFTEAHKSLPSLLKTFKLIKPVSENYCCIDENYRVREFNSAEEIVDAFIEIRLAYYQKRKQYIIDSNTDLLKRLYSKYLFCSGVIKGEIKINKQSKASIESQLEKIDKIIKVDGNYNYILNMPIHSLTKETMDKLSEQIKELKVLIKEVSTCTEQQMWINDLKGVEK